MENFFIDMRNFYQDQTNSMQQIQSQQESKINKVVQRVVMKTQEQTQMNQQYKLMIGTNTEKNKLQNPKNTSETKTHETSKNVKVIIPEKQPINKSSKVKLNRNFKPSEFSSKSNDDRESPLEIISLRQIQLVPLQQTVQQNQIQSLQSQEIIIEEKQDIQKQSYEIILEKQVSPKTTNKMNPNIRQPPQRNMQTRQQFKKDVIFRQIQQLDITQEQSNYSIGNKEILQPTHSHSNLNSQQNDQRIQLQEQVLKSKENQRSDKILEMDSEKEAFSFFFEEWQDFNISKLKSLSFKDLMKKAEDQWNEMTDKEKDVYYQRVFKTTQRIEQIDCQIQQQSDQQQDILEKHAKNLVDQQQEGQNHESEQPPIKRKKVKLN